MRFNKDVFLGDGEVDVVSGGVDTTNLATKTELQAKANLADVQALSTEVASTVKKVNGVIPSPDGNVVIDVPKVDTTNLATKTELQTKANATEVQTLSTQLADKASVQQVQTITTQLADKASKTEIATKVDKNGVNQITWDMIAQDAKNQIATGSPTPLSSDLSSASESEAATIKVAKDLNDRISELTQEVATLTTGADIDAGEF